MRFRKLTFAGLGVLGAVGASAVTLTPESAEVVIAPDACATVRFAADEMTNFLSRVFGTAVPLVRKPTDGKASVVLGANEWSKAEGIDPAAYPPDTFVIRSCSNRVYLCGTDDAGQSIRNSLGGGGYGVLFGHARATLHGAYDFLERFAGVRFYLPDEELGVITPRKDAIRVPEGQRAVTPDNLIRDPYMGGDGTWYNAKDGKDNNRLKALMWLRLRMSAFSIPCCHGSRDFRYIERFGETHPEYLAVKKDGSYRLDPKEFAAYQLCWSNPEFREVLYRDVKAYLTGQPASSRGLKGWGNNCRYGKYVDIMPDDSFQGCWCDGCRKAYAHEANGERTKHYATELIWGVVAEIGNRLIREGVKGDVVMMAYPPYRRVPDFDLPPNVQVMVAEGGPWSLVNETNLAREREEIRAWTKKLGHKVWIWTYPHKFGRTAIPNVPCMGPHAWGRYYAELSDDIFGTFAESECDRSIYNHLNYYVFSRVMWRTKTDIQGVIDEYHDLMYGPAAADMKAFNGLLERKWTREVTGRVEDTAVGPVAKPPSSYQLWHDVYSPETLAALRGHLRDAVRKVAPGSLEMRRIALMKREFLDPLVADAKDYLDRTDVRKALERRAARPNTSILPEMDAKNRWGGTKYEIDTKNFVTPPNSISFTGTKITGLRTNVPEMKPNTRYRLSYFIKTEGIEPQMMYGGGGGASLNIWDDRNHWWPSGNPFTGTMDWIYQEFEFTSGPLTNNHDPEKGKTNNSYLMMHMLYCSGKVWFDDVRLEEIE